MPMPTYPWELNYCFAINIIWFCVLAQRQRQRWHCTRYPFRGISFVLDRGHCDNMCWACQQSPAITTARYARHRWHSRWICRCAGAEVAVSVQPAHHQAKWSEGTIFSEGYEITSSIRAFGCVQKSHRRAKTIGLSCVYTGEGEKKNCFRFEFMPVQSGIWVIYWFMHTEWESVDGACSEPRFMAPHIDTRMNDCTERQSGDDCGYGHR